MNKYVCEYVFKSGEEKNTYMLKVTISIYWIMVVILNFLYYRVLIFLNWIIFRLNTYELFDYIFSMLNSVFSWVLLPTSEHTVLFSPCIM